ILVVAAATSPAAAQSVDDCAALAASRYEPGYEDSGLADTADFVADAAVETCVLALKDDPHDVRLEAWLGHAYAANGEEAKAVPLLEDAATKGNTVALRTLGDMLILGRGIAQDRARGVEMLRQAAEADFAPAALSLAYSYDFGDGIEADP